MDASCATLIGVVQKGLRCSYAGAYSWCEGVEGREAAEILAGGRGPALQRKRERAGMMSSVIPSAKYSCSGSPLIFWKGRTAIDGLSGSGNAGRWPSAAPLSRTR